MLYHYTKDIILVKEFLGHRFIENTQLYVQLRQEAICQCSRRQIYNSRRQLDRGSYQIRRSRFRAVHGNTGRSANEEA